MVRLKAYEDMLITIKEVQFQFLYGSIKSQPCLKNSTLLAHFNSSMVRLKVSLAELTMFVKKIFQFLYGSIKSITSIPAFSHSCNFNSSMVRLKELSAIFKKWHT